MGLCLNTDPMPLPFYFEGMGSKIMTHPLCLSIGWTSGKGRALVEGVYLMPFSLNQRIDKDSTDVMSTEDIPYESL